jgi:hypothetical protein
VKRGSGDTGGATGESLQTIYNLRVLYCSPRPSGLQLFSGIILNKLSSLQCSFSFHSSYVWKLAATEGGFLSGKEALSLEVIESQSLRELPPRLLPDLIVIAFSELLNAFFLILSSCLFLTGFLSNQGRRSFKVGHRKVSNKEGSRPHGAEQGDQANSGKPKKSPETVSREYQRAHESLEQTHKRLLRKYGEDQFILTAHRVYEDAKGIQYQPMAKNVPVKYISIAQAAEEFQIANPTLAEWVANGWLHNVTKVEHPTKPESGIVLVEPREVAKLKEKLGLGAEAAEPKLIALVEAAKKYDVAYETVRNWYRSGRLPEKGREIFPTHGGGKILVDEQEVIRLKNLRAPKKNPPSKLTE